VPKGNINPAKKLMKARPDAFVFELIKGKSSAAAGLASWVKNIIMYWDTIQIIVPLRKQVAETQA